MPYAAGSEIEAARYNAMFNTVNNVLGVGAGTSGYGQTLSSTTVAVGQTILAAHMDVLRDDIRRCHIHQTGIYPSLAAVTTANTIDDANGLNNSYDAYEAAVTLIDTNKNTIDNSRLSPTVTASTFTRATPWNATRTGTFTVTFAGATARRLYFNAGGLIQIGLNISGSATDKVTNWNDMFGATGMGTLSFGNIASNITGSGGKLTGSVNNSTLTTTNQTVYTNSVAGTYNTNSFNIQVQQDVTGFQITFTITLNDSATGNVDEDVDGSLLISVTNQMPTNGTQPFTTNTPSFGTMSGTITT
jgi:hypothetical protein